MNENDYVTSSVTGKKYLPSKVVRLLNIAQVTAYIKNGVELLDLYTSIDPKTDKPVLVFIFDREGSTWAYDLWCRYLLN